MDRKFKLELPTEVLHSIVVNAGMKLQDRKVIEANRFPRDDNEALETIRALQERYPELV